MVKKYFLFILGLLMLAPSIRADRIDDAVRASSFDEVNYLLAMKGNTVSQHRKDELVLLANEITLTRKRGKYPFGTLWDSYTTARGVVACVVAYKCARAMIRTGLPDMDDNLSLMWGIAKLEVFGIVGLTSVGLGIYWLIDGLRCSHGRNLFEQATQIEKRVNELKVAGDVV